VICIAISEASRAESDLRGDEHDPLDTSGVVTGYQLCRVM
jgi:hypothetical protein